MVRGRQATAAAKKAAAEKKAVSEDIAENEAGKDSTIEVEDDVDRSVDTIDEDENTTSKPADECEVEKGQEMQESAQLDEEGEEENEILEETNADMEVKNQSLDDPNTEAENNNEDKETVEGEEAAETANAELEKKEQPPLTEEDLAYIHELLTTKMKIGDGSEVIMFSFGPPLPGLNKKRNRSIVCHVCRVANMVRPSGVKQHINGKRHKENLNKKNIVKDRLKAPYLLFYTREGEQVKQFKIFPGENIEAVTPEYEDRLVDKTEWDFKPIDEGLSKSLHNDPIYEYNKTKPVIGIDYMLKMILKKTTKGFCVLCEELMPNDNIYKHLTSLQHQATYIIKHFPKLYEKVTQGLKNKADDANEINVRNIFRKLYRKIEVKHGFKKMIPVDGPDFRSFQYRYINKVRKTPHYSEHTLNFTDAEVSVLIKKCNENIPFNRPDPSSLPIGATVKETLKRKATNSSDNPSTKSARGLVTRGGKKHAFGADQKIEEIKEQYKQYKRNPESHPDYKKEWSQFWHERYEQLKKENVNPDTYDFEKEWKTYWNLRVRKLYLKKIFERKIQFRHDYNKSLSAIRRTKNMLLEKQGRVQPNNFDSMNMRQFGNFASMLHNQQNSANFGLDTFPGTVGRGQRYRGNRQGIRDAPRPPKQIKQEFQGQSPNIRPTKRPRSRKPVSVISVLRLLTALEDQLGSLGPKSVQLLGRAVLCEKNKQMQQLLTDSDVYVFLATAKEKLKGQIYANVVDNSKVEAVNRAINDLNEIINKMDLTTQTRANIKVEDSKANVGRCGVGNLEGLNTYTPTNDFASNRGSNMSRNFRNDNANYRSSNANEGGNFRSNDFIAPKDTDSYQSNYNDNRSCRASNFGNPDIHGSNNGGNYGNFPNPSMAVANYGANFSGGSSNDAGNFSNRGNYQPNNSTGNFTSTNVSSSRYRGGIDSIGNFPSGGGSYGNTNSNNMSYSSGRDTYQTGGGFNNNLYTSMAGNLGHNGNGIYSSATQSGSWISGHVPNAKPRDYDFMFNSDAGGQSNSFSLAEGRNSSFNYGNFGGNFARHN